MPSINDITIQQISDKIVFYKKEKRLQGFLLHKSQIRFMKMKKAVRQLKLKENPSNEDREYLQVYTNVYSSK